MKRFITGMLVAAFAVTFASVAMAQEEAHFEGFFTNSTCPPTNPNPGVFGVEGRGLVTALYAPLVSNFVANEYTWQIQGLVPVGNVQNGSTCYTSYAVNGPLGVAQFTIYEDPTNDARPVFYLCPSGVGPVPPGDPAYTNGAVYLRGHFTAFNSQYDNFSQTGTFTAQVNWDSGNANGFGNLPGGRHGSWTFGGTTNSPFACVPLASGYDQQITGRMFQLTTKAAGKTWGDIRKLYSK